MLLDRSGHRDLQTSQPVIQFGKYLGRVQARSSEREFAAPFTLRHCCDPKAPNRNPANAVEVFLTFPIKSARITRTHSGLLLMGTQPIRWGKRLRLGERRTRAGCYVRFGGLWPQQLLALGCRGPDIVRNLLGSGARGSSTLRLPGPVERIGK